MARVVMNREQLRQTLNERRISQNWLAIRSGLSSGYLSQVANGHRHLSSRARTRILEVLGLQFDALFRIVADSASNQR